MDDMTMGDAKLQTELSLAKSQVSTRNTMVVDVLLRVVSASREELGRARVPGDSAEARGTREEHGDLYLGSRGR